MLSPDPPVALVTGATDGLGRAVATGLASAGMTALIHGRDNEQGAAVLVDIKQATGNERVHWYRTDLASLREVRMLADSVSADFDGFQPARAHEQAHQAGYQGDAARRYSTPRRSLI